VLDNLGFNFWQGQEIFFSPKCPECLLFLPSLLRVVNGYWGVPSLEVKWVGHEPTTDLHLVLRLRMSEAVLLVLLLCACMACTGTS